LGQLLFDSFYSKKIKEEVKSEVIKEEVKSEEIKVKRGL
jgi:hypothetical protein